MNKLICILAGVVITLLPSCAILWNNKDTVVTVITNEPTQIEVEGNTMNNLRTRRSISAIRKHAPLTLTVFNDSLSKTVDVKSHLDGAYWANALWLPYGLVGFAADMFSLKRYNYPDIVSIDMHQKDDRYFTYDIFDTSYIKLRNVISITPLRLIDLFNPAVEITYERRFTPHFSAQFMASYLLPMSIWQDTWRNHSFFPDIKGFKLSGEAKIYLRPTAPVGPYLSAELGYLNSRYREESSNFLYAHDYDDFGVHKQMGILNFKFGYQYIIAAHLMLDIYAGIGVQYKNVVYFDTDPSNRQLTTNWLSSDRKGVTWSVNIPLNCRIGWAF